MSPKGQSIPKFWDKFVKAYASHHAYWYFPKARAVNNVAEVRGIFRVLADFQGRPWKEVKPEFLKALEDKRLFERHAKEQTESDSLAMARILKVTFDNLGFSWIDENDSVSLTLAGKTFIEIDNPASIFDRQLWRYQIANPLWSGAKDVRLFPHSFLVEALLACDLVLSREEFILFVSRSRTQDDIDYVVEHISAWRELDEDVQNRIIEKLYNIPLDEKDEDKTMINRVSLNSSYCLAFHGSASYMRRNTMVRDQEYALSVTRVASRALSARLEQFHRETVFIEYESPKDWISAYGDLENRSTRSEAVEYYADRSNVEKAVAAFQMLPAEAREGFTEEQYREVQIQEKHLEDMLEHNISRLGDGLSLVKRGRQYETLVGPIDLLAVDQDGYVVVELKKGRTADKVFGQLCRYMGFVKREVAEGKPVRGIIVGRDIDKKLLYAIEAVPKGLVMLKAFDIRLAVEDRSLA
jgi:RecB family endonuclease NucS